MHAFANEIHNFQNRLYSRLLFSKITDNNFLDERLQRSKLYAYRGRLAAKFDLTKKKRERGRGGGKHFPAENEHRDRLYRRCPVSLFLQYSAGGCLGCCCGSPREVTEFRGGQWGVGGMGLPHVLFQSALSAHSPSVIIHCPVIFFNHRSPRRSGASRSLWQARVERIRLNTLRYPPAGTKDKEIGDEGDAGTEMRIAT